MPPSQTRIWLVRLAVGLVASALVWALAIAVRDASATRLADGSRLRVWGSRRGMPATLLVGENYQRKPFLWIPAQFRQRLGLVPLPLSVYTSDGDLNADCLFVWFTRFDRGRGGYRWKLFSRVEVVDASGQVLGEAAQSPFVAAELKGGVVWVPHPPADGAAFRLRLFGGNPVRLLGEIEVPAAATSAPLRTASPRR